MSDLPNGWEEKRLGGYINIFSGKTRPKEKGTIPVYGGNGILNYTNQFNQSNETIIIGRVGAYCGNVFYEQNNFWLSDNALGIKNKDNSDINFLYYKLIDMKLNNHSIGGAQPLLTQSIIKDLKINIPIKVDEQKQIANILSSFDKKIELLKEQNQTLETMSEVVFKKSIQNKDDLIETTLGELVNIKYGKDHKHLKDGDYALYGSGGIMRHVEKPLYEKESILIPRKGTLGNLFFTQKPFWSVDTIFYTEIDETKVFPIYLYYQLKRFDLANLNVGSAVPSLTTKVLNVVKLNIPNVINQKKTVDSLKVFNRKFLNNISQIKILEETRDSLLPKLMSGQKRVFEYDN